MPVLLIISIYVISNQTILHRRSQLRNNREYMQRSVQSDNNPGDLHTSGDLHLSSETVSGTSADSGRGLSETQPDIADDKCRSFIYIYINQLFNHNDNCKMLILPK